MFLRKFRFFYARKNATHIEAGIVSKIYASGGSGGAGAGRAGAGLDVKKNLPKDRQVSIIHSWFYSVSFYLCIERRFL